MDRVLERDAELAALEDTARRGGGLVLVGGEDGIGKTTLVRALQERLGEEVGLVIGACEPPSVPVPVPVPLGPLRELAQLDDGGDPLLVGRLLLEKLAAQGPVVAVVEDAPWADPTTLDVPRRVEGSPIAFLVTYRDDEVAANPPLERLLGDLATSPLVRRLQLRPLSDAAVRELAEPLGVDPDPVVRAGIEDYVRALGEPAQWPWLQPPPDGPRVPAERSPPSSRSSASSGTGRRRLRSDDVRHRRPSVRSTRTERGRRSRSSRPDCRWDSDDGRVRSAEDRRRRARARGGVARERGGYTVGVLAADLVALVLVCVVVAFVAVVVVGLHVWGAIQDGREEKTMWRRRHPGG